MAQEATPLTTGAIKQVNPDETIVRPHDKVTVYSTGNAFAAKGDAMEVHPELAKKLIASGKATETESKGTKKDA